MKWRIVSMALLASTLMVAGCAKEPATDEFIPEAADTTEPPTAVLSFTASLDTIPIKYISNTLFWSSNDDNAKCDASGEWTGSRPSSGSEAFPEVSSRLAGPKTFILKCDGPLGTTNGTVTIQVQNGIVAWGDSLTAGYPDLLAAMQDRRVANYGVGGQTSSQIVARQGSVPSEIQFANSTILADDESVVETMSAGPLTSQGVDTLAGTIGGIHGKLVRTTAPLVDPVRLVFLRDTPGAAHEQILPEPFQPDTDAERTYVTIFWMGRNDATQPDVVKANIAEAVAYLKTDQYVVLSILNGEGEPAGTPQYDTIMQLNRDLAATYAGHFIDIRRILLDAANPEDPADQATRAADVPPKSLRRDPLHLNPAGDKIVATAVDKFLKAHSWQ